MHYNHHPFSISTQKKCELKQAQKDSNYVSVGGALPLCIHANNLYSSVMHESVFWFRKRNPASKKFGDNNGKKNQMGWNESKHTKGSKHTQCQILRRAELCISMYSYVWVCVNLSAIHTAQSIQKTHQYSWNSITTRLVQHEWRKKSGRKKVWNWISATYLL